MHASFACCVIPVYVFSKLILKLPRKLKFARHKAFAAQNGEFERFVGFALIVTTRYKKESRV